MKKFLLWGVFVFSYLFSFTGVAYSQADIYTGTIDIYVTGYGKIQLYSNPPAYDISQVTRASVLVGTGSHSVFDYNNDQDIEVATELASSPSWGDFEITGLYNGTYLGVPADVPPSILLRQNVYSWTNASYAIVKYTVISQETSSMDAIIGLDLIPEVDNIDTGGDTVTYSSNSGIISVHKASYVGFKVLSEELKGLAMFTYYSGYDEDTTYWRNLSLTTFDSHLVTDVDDPVMIPSFNSKTIAAGDSVTFYVAISYGANETEMLASMEQAQQKYNLYTSVESDLNNVPSNFVLEQNYPNPFNPSTKISFGLPHRSTVVLKIFNTLGQEVAELVNKSLEAGTYSYDFDASKLSSGIYIYSLQTDAGVISKKMTLLK
jgi:hypothetical protein